MAGKGMDRPRERDPKVRLSDAEDHFRQMRRIWEWQRDRELRKTSDDRRPRSRRPDEPDFSWWGPY